MLQWIWLGMMGISLLYACLSGNAESVLTSALKGTGDAIALTIQLGAGYLFFCGMIRIMRAAGVPQRLNRLIKPLLHALMPSVCDRATQEAIAMNLSMNMLGLGNAATPSGMEAMRLMERERSVRPGAQEDMYMLLVLNATSIQLLPTTVLALRVAAGSAVPNEILLPSLICTAFSTVVGAALALLCRSWRKKHD